MEKRQRPTFVLCPPRPGEMGWVVSRHGALYAEEEGYNDQFEGVVAQVVADFLRCHDPAKERCWIAETNGAPVGSVMLVRKSPRVAKLRLLLVEPSARGLGIGSALIRECIAFARQAGYGKMTLWTHTNLRAARRLYQQAGFRLVSAQRNPSFGRKLVDETWELEL
ncbi:MAG: GNAT family N-acetyltransferase [Acidobacteriia bacterium]|nr:GNAT family N-acetyltransferase [Terriglobia bacterium]